ncbi:TRAP-type C4-dicarboxylate transport system, periplasmic component [Marinobacterium lacunae]|uniref:TRAP-type C4-dicarboxylate transport system, periplasmic component n=1 Tax=Marinobacterium lacunae TaxID=1232683 RepID=A0A081G398_9GAMM|nr:DctP family TRAP transporter solute-binding subunit [Marinobacterium lacunae]KEA65253.1 TRAP-type C4-dicarboxylate transport system, periplasmic component [Marinobacterium lacunae]
MITIKKPLVSLATIGLSAMIWAAPASAEKVMKIAHMNPGGPFESHAGAMVTVFKSLVEAGTNGSIKVQHFPDGQLGKDNEVIDQVRMGVVQSSISSAGGVAQHYPPVGVFDLPFAFPNIATAHDVINLDSDFGKMFAEDMHAKTGLKVIGLLDSGGFFALTNSKKEVTTLDDMNGLKIRTMTLPTHETIINSVGGKATPLPWAEVYTALQTGVADGQMNPVPTISFAKFEEVQPYMTLTNHIITPYVWMINEKFYDGLTPEEQRVVDYAAKAAVDAGRGVSRLIEASDTRGLPYLASKMKISTLSEEERQKFAAATQPAVKKLIEEQYGDEGMKLMQALESSIEKASN